MAFFRFGECILELVERGPAPALWGVVVVVDELDRVRPPASPATLSSRGAGSRPSAATPG